MKNLRPPKSVACLIAISLGALTLSAAPLTIYDGADQTGTSGTVNNNNVKVGSAIPKGLNDKISSFTLQKGYGVCFATNSNVVGDSKIYTALDGEKKFNIQGVLNNNVSFIRVFKIKTDIKKKGHAGKDTDLATAVGSSWYYRWGDNGTAVTGVEYVPMKWGGGDSATFADTWDTKDASCLLAFNEPDNKNQANITVEKAVDYYEDLLPCGLRMGSPVVEQDKYKTWLKDFMDDAKLRKLRVDFLAAHWYDWGNNTKVSTGAQIAARLEAKMIDLRATCGSNMKIWLTEFNANPGRSSETIHADFIKSAIGWINGESWMERYAYFQNGGGKFGTATKLSTAGKAYRDAPNSASSYSGTNNLGY